MASRNPTLATVPLPAAPRRLPALPADVTAVARPLERPRPVLTAAPPEPEDAFIQLPERPRSLPRAIAEDLDAVARVTVGNVARLLPGVAGGPSREDYGRALRGAFTAIDPVGTAAEVGVASVLDWIAGVPDPERRTLLARAYEEGTFDAALRATGMTEAFERWAASHPRLGLASSILGGSLGGSLAEGAVRGTVRAAGRAAAREVAGNASELPMDLASRLSRAREQGFTTEAYRGLRDARYGEGGIYFTPEPEAAAAYAAGSAYRAADEEFPEGAAIMPVRLRSRRTLHVNDVDDIIREIGEIPGATDSGYYVYEVLDDPRVQQALREKGYDTIVFEDALPDSNQPHKTILVLDPRNVRSRFARFDPANADSPNLLGAATPAAMAALGLAGAGGLAAVGAANRDEETMSTPNLQQATIPFGGDPRQRAADLWDRLVASGMDPEEATRRVTEITGVSADAGAPAAASAPSDAPSPEVRMEPWRGALASAVQGATFGFGDEIGAAIRAAPALLPGGQSFSDAYRENVEAAREGLRQFREEHPLASLGSEVAGGLVWGGAGALRNLGTTGVRTAAGRLLAQPIATGAVEGAIAGAGAAEGGVGERVTGALGGGLIGGLTGGIVQGLGAIRGAAGRAVGRLRSAFEREGIDPARAIPELRPGETLMDVGEVGGPLQRLARAAESIPSEGAAQIRRTLTQRAEEAPTRIKETLQREARLTFEDAVQTVDDLVAQRAARARPFYREAYRYSVSDDVVRGLFDDPEFQRAYRLAQRTAAQEVGARQALAAAGLPIPDDLADAEVLPQLFRVTEEGKVEFLTKSIPVRALDYMKSALQEVIDQDIAGGRLSKRGAMMLKRKLDAFLARVDELVPEYRQARATFGGLSQAMEAFEMARTGSAERGLKAFLNEDPRRIAKVLSEMSPSEQAFYRRGALDAVRQRLESASDGRDLTRVIFGNPEMRARIRTLFESEDDFMRFADAMERERRMAQGRQFILGGSPTARIQAEQADLIAETPATRLTQALDVMLAPVEAGRRGLRAIGHRLAVGGGEATVNELAPFLTATGPEAAGMVGDALTEALRRDAIRAELIRALTAGTATPAGLAAGRAVAAPVGERR